MIFVRVSLQHSALFLQWFRDLPVPLLTREFLHAFASISDINELKEQVRTLNLLVLMLPDLHQKVLKVRDHSNTLVVHVACFIDNDPDGIPSDC